jgi:acyl-CoA thioesterase-1
LIIKRFLYRTLRVLLPAGLLFLCLASGARALQPAAQHSILVVGDSISAAYGMSLEQGWVSLLAEHLQTSGPDNQVINASISGETTAGGLRRLPELLDRHSPGLVIIELGANDGMRGYPIASLRANLDKMVELSLAADARVIILAMEIPPNYGARYTAAFRESFVLAASDPRTSLSPFLLDGVATNPELMQADGIHPTAQAQPILLANALPTIEAALAQQ